MMTTEEYIERLRTLLNEAAENGLEEISLMGTDTVNLSSIIDNTFPQAWERIPQDDLVGKSVDITATPLAEKGKDSQVGYINLPADYHKLTYLKMSGWKIPVTITYGRSSEIGIMQGFTFARGSSSRPVAIVENHEDGWRLYYYTLPLGREHKVERFSYASQPSIDNINVKDSAITTLLNYHALYVSIALDRTSMIKYFTELINQG